MNDLIAELKDMATRHNTLYQDRSRTLLAVCQRR